MGHERQRVLKLIRRCFSDLVINFVRLFMYKCDSIKGNDENTKKSFPSALL